MLQNSTVSKLVIYAKFEDSSDEIIEDIAILLMIGSKVLRCKVIGKNVDDTDEELGQDILDEETDARLFDKHTKFKFKRIDSDHQLLIEETFETLNKFRKTLVRLTGQEDEDCEYVIYHDNSDNTSPTGFYSYLEEYIEQRDDLIVPIRFKDIFNSLESPKTILARYGFTDINYIESSSVSVGSFVGVSFDLSLGKS
jgi:hypothetical protein